MPKSKKKQYPASQGVTWMKIPKGITNKKGHEKPLEKVPPGTKIPIDKKPPTTIKKKK